MKKGKVLQGSKIGFMNSKYFMLAEAIILLVLVAVGTGHLSPSAVKSADIVATSSSNILPEPSPLVSSVPSPKPQTETPVNYGKSIRVPILTYHYIGKNPDPADFARDSLSIDPELFDEQMGYLSRQGYNPIDLDTLLAGLSGSVILPPKPVVITFDDGYVDLYVNAFPILQKYRLKAVAFIPTGLVGTSYYASWDQLAEMSASGLISLQAHSIRHVNLVALSPEILAKELTESKKTLEEKFGKPVNFMAYPYGSSNAAVWAAVKKAGYLGALGTWSSPIISEGVIFDMPRVRIPGGATLSTFISKL